MKRFHVHAHGTDLQASIGFYTRLFGAEPSRVESDYAKWTAGRHSGHAVRLLLLNASPR